MNTLFFLLLGMMPSHCCRLQYSCRIQCQDPRSGLVLVTLSHLIMYYTFWLTGWRANPQWWALYFPSSMRTFVWSDLVFSLPHVHLVLIHFGKACSLLGLTHSNPVSVFLVLHRPASSSYLFLVRDTELSTVVSSYLNQSIADLLCWYLKAQNNKMYV